MKSFNEYTCHGHSIKVLINASAHCLWLDYTHEILVDNKKVKRSNKRSLTQSLTRFSFYHQGNQLKGRVISSGIPFAPIINQSTIVDDTLLGHKRMVINRRLVSYILLGSLLSSLYFL